MDLIKKWYADGIRENKLWLIVIKFRDDFMIYNDYYPSDNKPESTLDDLLTYWNNSDWSVSKLYSLEYPLKEENESNVKGEGQKINH